MAVSGSDGRFGFRWHPIARFRCGLRGPGLLGIVFSGLAGFPRALTHSQACVDGAIRQGLRMFVGSGQAGAGVPPASTHC